MRSLRLGTLLCALGAGACGGHVSDPTHDAGSAISPVPVGEPQAGAARPPQPAPSPDPSSGAEEAAAAEAAAVAADRARLEAERARLEAEREAFEAAYPKHGVVYHFLAQVFAEPDNRSRVIGYMRRGAHLRAKAAVEGRGCSGGWHEVPGGGYVCGGNGFLMGDRPQSFEPSPVPPALDDALPYLYAYTTRDDVAQYWRLPTLEEEGQASGLFQELRRAEARRSARGGDAGPEAVDGGVDTTPAPDEEAAAQADEVEAPPPPGQEEDEGEVEPTEEDGVAFPDFVRMRMLRGFYVSLDQRDETDAGRQFYRTVRGAYVRASELTPNEPPESRGVVLGGSWELPLAIVFRNGATKYRRDPASGRLSRAGEVERHQAFVMAQDDLVVGDRRYVVGRDGTIVREPSVRMVRAVGRPPGVPEGARWIHVDLSQQSLVAYEGDAPVFATLVSTGKPGHETPTGLYRIQSKHVSTTMDDDSTEDGAYSIEDVPWTMYFHGNYALHGAFWHYTFGRVRSHGCVNLSPVDARWLFQWTTPTLPASWHGIFAEPRRHPGTFVFIEE